MTPDEVPFADAVGYAGWLGSEVAARLQESDVPAGEWAACVPLGPGTQAYLLLWTAWDAFETARTTLQDRPSASALGSIRLLVEAAAAIRWLGVDDRAERSWRAHRLALATARGTPRIVNALAQPKQAHNAIKNKWVEVADEVVASAEGIGKGDLHPASRKDYLGGLESSSTTSRLSHVMLSETGSRVNLLFPVQYGEGEMTHLFSGGAVAQRVLWLAVACEVMVAAGIDTSRLLGWEPWAARLAEQARAHSALAEWSNGYARAARAGVGELHADGPG